jgi:hypothetical protein
MSSRARGMAATRTAALALVLAATACSHMPSVKWPWAKESKPAPPPPVHVLDITAAGSAASFPQSLERNTLLVDLSAVSGTGSLTLKPAAGSSWPVRLAFKVTPGAIGLLEVRADQRVVLPITSAAGTPIDLELAPGVYTTATPQMTVSWGPLPPAPTADQSVPMR